MKLHLCFLLCLGFLGNCTSSEKDPKPWDLKPVEDMQADLRVDEDMQADLRVDIDTSSDSNTDEDMGFPGRSCAPSEGRLSFKPRRNIEEVFGCVTALASIDLSFFFEPTIPLHWFESLREIGPGEDLYLSVTDVEEVNSFQNLERIGRHFTILDAQQLNDLSGFKKIRHIGGTLGLQGLPIKNLAGFESLEYVGGLDFFGLNDLESLEGLKSLRRIDGDLSMSIENITEAQFKVFLERVEVGGEITFKGEKWVP